MKITTLILTATLLLVLKSNSQQLVIDSAYGKDGTYQRTPIFEFTDVGSIRLQEDKKVLLSTLNYDEYYSEEAFIERINPDGTLDVTFGNNGLQRFSGQVRDFMLQPDGKIIVVSFIGEDEVFTIQLSRILTNGLPDASFGVNGTTIVEESAHYIYSICLLLKSDGNIITSYYQSYYDQSTIKQYDAAGKPDPLFGNNGTIKTSYPLENIRDLLLLPSDKFLAVGQFPSAALNSYSNDLVIFNANGTVDSSNGTDGVVFLNNRVVNNVYNNVSTKYFNSKILFYGEDDKKNVLYRFNSQLEADNTFGVNGKVIGTSFSPQSIERLVDVQPNGRIIVNTTRENELQRYYRDGTLDTTFGNNSIFTEPVSRDEMTFTVDKDRLFTAGVDFIATGDVILGFIYKPLHNGAKSDNNTLLNKNHFTFYPNPAKNILNLRVNGVAKFTLTNQAGRMFITKAIENYGTLNLSNIPGGIYFLNNILTGEKQSVIVIK